MSVEAASRMKTARPSSLFRLRTMLRLPRLTALKLGLSAPTAPGICRVESPAGGSILITSAPRSASSIEQNGPAMTCVTSSTRSPFSAEEDDVVISSSDYLVIRLSGHFDYRVFAQRHAYHLRDRRIHRHPDLQSPRGAQRDDVGDVRGAGRRLRPRRS